jgi:hypothetical protein
MKAIDVLIDWNGLQHLVAVQMRGEGQLHDRT